MGKGLGKGEGWGRSFQLWRRNQRERSSFVLESFWWGINHVWGPLSAVTVSGTGKPKAYVPSAWRCWSWLPWITEEIYSLCNQSRSLRGRKKRKHRPVRIYASAGEGRVITRGGKEKNCGFNPRKLWLFVPESTLVDGTRMKGGHCCRRRSIQIEQHELSEQTVWLKFLSLPVIFSLIDLWCSLLVVPFL